MVDVVGGVVEVDVEPSRPGEREGGSDIGLVLWRRILRRELAAIAEGREPKRWTRAPADVLPTLGF